MADLFSVGLNVDNACIISDEFNECAVNGRYHYARSHLAMCKWSEFKQIIAVHTGSQSNIFSFQYKKDEVFCYGFLRESQRDLFHQSSPLHIIPGGVYAYCIDYFRVTEHWALSVSGSGLSNVVTALSRIEGMYNISRIRSGCHGCSTLWMTHDGSLYVNGHNECGQLGLGDSVNQSDTEYVAAPTLCTIGPDDADLKCVDGASSGCFNIVVGHDGSVWIAGRYDQCSSEDNSNKTAKFIPLESLREHHIVAVAASYSAAFFIDQNGMVYARGCNEDGQLGLGDDADEHYPIQIPIDPNAQICDTDLEAVRIPFFKKMSIRIESVRCGSEHTLALSNDHAVYGWGRNKDGQCGVSNGQNRKIIHSPERIDFPTQTDIERIDCGLSHSGCISSDNEVFLWGCNQNNRCCFEIDEGAPWGLCGWTVYTPQCVNDYVLGQSKKEQIVDVFLGCHTTMFLLK